MAVVDAENKLSIRPVKVGERFGNLWSEDACGTAARSRFPSNWELSTARATAAVRFLTENAGVDPRRLGAVGYGEFRPVADNATPEGRARNRRIAITILSEELAGADTAPAAAPKSSPPPGPAAAATNALADPPLRSR